MRDVELDFSREEYAARLAKVRAAMDAAGVEVMVAADPSNMAWLTGYDGWSFYTPQAVVLSHDGEPWWWGRRMDANGARRTVYMDESRILDYSDDHVMSIEHHAFAQLGGLLVDLGLSSGRVGVELDNYYYSAAAHQNLVAALPDTEVVDATGLVNWQRGVKSEQELVYMRRAARIVELMHERIRELVEPGMRKCDLVGEIYRTAMSGTEEFGGDYAAIVPMLPTGADASAPHLTWDDKPFERGAGTFFEIAGCYNRYHCPLSRSPALTAATSCRCAGPCTSAPRRPRCSRSRRRCSTRSKMALTRPGPGTGRATLPTPSTEPSRRSASTKRGAAAIRSGSATRLTGVSAPSRFGPPTSRSSSRA